MVIKLLAVCLCIFVNMIAVLGQSHTQSAGSLIEKILDKYQSDSLLSYQVEFSFFNLVRQSDILYFDVITQQNDKNIAGWDTYLVEYSSKTRDSIDLTILQVENELYAKFEVSKFLHVSNEFSSLPKGNFYSARLFLVPKSTVLNDFELYKQDYFFYTNRQLEYLDSLFPIAFELAGKTKPVLIREKVRDDGVVSYMISVDTVTSEILWYLEYKKMNKDFGEYMFGNISIYSRTSPVAQTDTLLTKKQYFLNFDVENVVVLESGKDQTSPRPTSKDTLPFSAEEVLSLKFVDKENKPQSIVLDKPWNIIDFWYFNCLPCIKSLFQLNKLYADSSLTDVNFWALNFIDQDIKVLNALHSRGLDFPAYLLNSNSPADFRIPAYPLLIVLDQTGTIVYYKYGYIESTIDEILEIISP